MDQTHDANGGQRVDACPQKSAHNGALGGLWLLAWLGQQLLILAAIADLELFGGLELV